MIDGIKFDCQNTPNWTDNKNLSFFSSLNISTGEEPKKKYANFNGLYFEIIKGIETYHKVRGSLHKYFNKGETNATDYSFMDFIETCEILKQNFDIKANETILHGFEMGTNTLLPFYVDEVLRCIKFLRMHQFKQETKNGNLLSITFEFQRYSVKIYDKILQETGEKSKLMRLEISIDKMQWVKDKKMKIVTLADLQNRVVWTELAKELLLIWDDIVFVDNSLKYKLMSNHEHKKYLEYLNANYWAELKKDKFYDEKKYLIKLQTNYGSRINKKQIIRNIIAKKCQLLTTETISINEDELTTFEPQKSNGKQSEKSQRLKNNKKAQINHLDKGLERYNNIDIDLMRNEGVKSERESLSKDKKIENKKCKCINCKKTIKEKKASTKFCGIKCKNEFNGRERTKANQKKLTNERETLEKVLKDLQYTNLSLLIIYNENGLNYADQLKQKEINAPNEWIEQILRVLITDNKNALPIEFTTVRAKKLIRELVKINSNI